MHVFKVISKNGSPYNKETLVVARDFNTAIELLHLTPKDVKCVWYLGSPVIEGVDDYPDVAHACDTAREVSASLDLSSPLSDKESRNVSIAAKAYKAAREERIEQMIGCGYLE